MFSLASVPQGSVWVVVGLIPFRNEAAMRAGPSRYHRARSVGRMVDTFKILGVASCNEFGASKEKRRRSFRLDFLATYRASFAVGGERLAN